MYPPTALPSFMVLPCIPIRRFTTLLQRELLLLRARFPSGSVWPWALPGVVVGVGVAAGVAMTSTSMSTTISTATPTSAIVATERTSVTGHKTPATNFSIIRNIGAARPTRTGQRPTNTEERRAETRCPSVRPAPANRQTDKAAMWVAAVLLGVGPASAVAPPGPVRATAPEAQAIGPVGPA